MTRVIVYVYGQPEKTVEHRFESNDAARIALMEIGFEYSESGGNWTCYKAGTPHHIAVTQEYNPLSALISKLT